MTGRVVVLNGVSSAGKSSIVRSLETIATHPLLSVAMDDYLTGLPPETFGTPDGLTFVTRAEDGHVVTEAIAGPLVHEALSDMRRAVAAMARDGRNVVVDEVMLGRNDEADYRRSIPHSRLALVGIHAPLAVVEARELARGDRTLGLARWQFDRIHRERRYDLEIDTTTGTPADHAATICRAFDL